MTDSTRASRLAVGVLGLVLGLMPVAMAIGHHAAPTARVLAGCNDVVDTTDSFSMNCAPTMIPDMSDQLTEAEVAEPGWNAHPGGGGGGPR